MGELNARRKKDRDELHQQWRDNDAEYADWQRKDQAKKDGVQGNIAKLMAVCAHPNPTSNRSSMGWLHSLT